jgi:hypothetical protein
MSKVKITADKNGNIITISENNPEYGWIFVEQTATQFDNGWMKTVVRKTRINGKTSELDEAKFTAGQEIPGKIVVLESLVPFNNEEPDRDLKIAGKTGIICRYEDQPIYRQSYFTTNLNSYDELINHTNRDEIREVMLAQKMLSELPSEEAAL